MSIGHYENFPVASLLLPSRLREPIEMVYRFARSADDLADEGDDPPDIRLAKLNDYQRRLTEIDSGASPDDPFFTSLARVIRDHRLPIQPFRDLVDAFTQDVIKKRYANFGELADYCRRSANPVGRLLLHFFKQTTDSNCRQSDAICSALQLINFWQDVDLDYIKDQRIYLPQDEMARHGVTELHISRQTCDDAWQALMKFQVERARQMMLSGEPLGRALPGRIGLEIRATIQGGLRILEKIENVGYDVFRRRPKLRASDWPLLLLRAV